MVGLQRGLLAISVLCAHSIHVNIGVVNDPPSCIVDFSLLAELQAAGSTQTNLAFSGLDIEIFSYLMTRARSVYPAFANETLTWTYVLAPDNQYGAQTNGSWNGMIGMLLRREIQAAAASFSITSARITAGVAFAQPYYESGLALLTAKESSKSDWWRFLQPFTPRVWAIFIFSMTCGIISLWLIDRYSPFGYHNNPVLNKMKREYNLSNSIFAGILVIFNKDPDASPKACSTRVMMFGLTVVSAFLLSSYIAGLTTMLTIRDTQARVSSWQQLVQQKEYLLGTLDNSSWVSAITGHADPSIRSLASRLVRFPNDALGVEAVRSGKIAGYARGIGSVKYLSLAPPCNLIVIEPAITNVRQTFAYDSNFMPDVWPRVFDEGLAILTVSERAAEWMAKYFATAGSCADSPQVIVASSSLQPGDIVGIVIVYAALVLIAGALLLCEKRVFAAKGSRSMPCRKLHKLLGGTF